MIYDLPCAPQKPRSDRQQYNASSSATGQTVEPQHKYLCLPITILLAADDVAITIVSTPGGSSLSGRG